MKYFYEPVDMNQWNMFEKVKSIGHIEPFLATNEMEIGDIMFLHIGQQNDNYKSGIYAVGEIVSSPYVLKDRPQDYCNNKNTVDVRIIKINYKEPFVTYEESMNYINQFRSVHKLDDESGMNLYQKIYNEYDDIDINQKRIQSKEDWIDILNNEEKIENNKVNEILCYMFQCKDYTSNAKRIGEFLNVPIATINTIIVNFGRRIINLKNIENQVNPDDGMKIYWNIPFTTVSHKNRHIFTWKLREELVQALAEKFNLKVVNNKDINYEIEKYKKINNPNDFEKEIANELELREKFVKKFDINYLINMDYDDYVIGKLNIEESGKESFCYLIETKMRKLGEMRGATVDKFGVWYSKEKMNYDYANKYGDNLKQAFERVKQELCMLIVSANNDDYEAIDSSLLPPLFRGKILSTYFPNKFLCIFKEDDVEKFLDILNIPYDMHKVNTIEEKKLLLKQFKESNSLLCNLSNYYFMKFLYDTFKTELEVEHTVNGEIDYDFEYIEFEYLGAHKIEQRERIRLRETDYEKINKNKKDIGNRGERAVLNHEKEKLYKLGLNNLAEQVQFVENDAIGYDINSFDENGNEIHIEVKTNSGKSNKNIEFYLTYNELSKMKQDDKYYIYYLYDIKGKTKCHIVNKKILLENKEEYLQPVTYKVNIDVHKKD